MDIKIIKDLENCNTKEIKQFSLSGLKTFARIANVKDGDTLEVIIPLFDNFYKFITRLKGIDTCETKTNNDDIKNIGLKAKYRVIELLTGKKYNSIKKEEIKNIFEENKIIVTIEFYDYDKYGRILSDIFIYDKNNKNKISLSSILLHEKLAYIYDGGTKLSTEEQLNILS